jgi:hypothetical protein
LRRQIGAGLSQEVGTSTSQPDLEYKDHRK